MTDIADQIAAVTDEKPLVTLAGGVLERTTWALVRDRVTVKVVTTNARSGPPFLTIADIDAKLVMPGEKVPENGYAVVNVTGHEAFTRPGVPCDQWGSMHPSHGSHF